MQLGEFEKITDIAKKKMSNYLSLSARANYHNVELRKEDFLNYWVAVVAYETGLKKGSNELS